MNETNHKAKNTNPNTVRFVEPLCSAARHAVNQQLKENHKTMKVWIFYCMDALLMSEFNWIVTIIINWHIEAVMNFREQKCGHYKIIKQQIKNSHIMMTKNWSEECPVTPGNNFTYL